MRKIIFTLFLLIASATVSAQSRNLERLAGEEGISYVYVSKAMLGLISGSNASVNGLNVSGLTEKLNALQVVSADRPDAVRRLRAEADAFPKANMEVLMQVIDEGSRTEYFTLKQGERITDLLMLYDSGDSYTLLLIQGNFTSRDIQEITESTRK